MSFKRNMLKATTNKTSLALLKNMDSNMKLQFVEKCDQRFDCQSKG